MCGVGGYGRVECVGVGVWGVERVCVVERWVMMWIKWM